VAAPPLERKYLATPQSGAAGRVLASPFQFFTTGEEALRVTSACSTAGTLIALHYRFLDPEKGITANRETQTASSDRTAVTSEFSLGAGALLNLTVFAETGAPKMGQCFVRVQLIRGRGAAAVVMGTLVQGYVTGNQDLAWPGSALQYSTDGPGVIRTIVGTFPAPPSEFSESVPTGAQWELLAVTSRIITDATAGDRRPRLEIQLFPDTYLRSAIDPGIPPSSFARVTWFPGAIFPSAYDSGAVTGALPARLIVPAGGIIFCTTAGKALADSWEAPRLIVREWLQVN
jgi:hypothetical protein